MKALLLSIGLAIVLPATALAHGFGQTIQVESNGYLLAVDSASERLVAGSAERIGFDITPKIGTGTPEFSHVWVRVMSPDSALLFAGFIVRSDIGQTGMTFAFPAAGEYEVSVRFLEGEHVIAEGTLVLPVDASSVWSSLDLLRAFAILEFFGISVLGVILVTRKYSRISDDR